MSNVVDDERAVSPVVSKTLAIGIAMLYVAGMTAALGGGVVPEYQSRTGGELGERVLATAAGTVERAPPGVEGDVETTTTVTLPRRIDDEPYTLVVTGRTIRLDHPDVEIGAETRLLLPENVTVADGTWQSGGNLVIEVTGPRDDRTVTIGGEP